jgi:hypothetical protein
MAFRLSVCLLVVFRRHACGHAASSDRLLARRLPLLRRPTKQTRGRPPIIEAMQKNSVAGPGSGASNYSHRVFRLDTDPAFIALANVADQTDLKARGAVNSAKANPAFLLTANNLAAPITLVSHGSRAQWCEFNGGRFRSFDLCGEGLY